MARAAGGTRQRLKPGLAIEWSRSRNIGRRCVRREKSWEIRPDAECRRGMRGPDTNSTPMQSAGEECGDRTPTTQYGVSGDGRPVHGAPDRPSSSLLSPLASSPEFRIPLLHPASGRNSASYAASRINRPMKRAILFLLCPLLLGAQSSRTKIVMLGTGTPIPDPDRMGPSVAVIVDSVPYIFDAGTGIVRRAAAAQRAGVPGLRMPNLQRVFLTHLHSDHTLGLADLLFTPWIQGRSVPLEVYGPPGTQRLVNGILDGNDEDIRERLASSGGPSANGWRANVHEIAEGVVYKDARVTIRAFAVPHSGWKYAFGYRIETPDRTIVISGDTRPSPAIAAACNGCDVLIHEVYSDSGFASIPAVRQKYHAQSHTSATQLGTIATNARPKLLILTHLLFFGASEDRLMAEVRSTFRGNVVLARDLQLF